MIVKCAVRAELCGGLLVPTVAYCSVRTPLRLVAQDVISTVAVTFLP